MSVMSNPERIKMGLEYYPWGRPSQSFSVVDKDGNLSLYDPSLVMTRGANLPLSGKVLNILFTPLGFWHSRQAKKLLPETEELGREAFSRVVDLDQKYELPPGTTKVFFTETREKLKDREVRDRLGGDFAIEANDALIAINNYLDSFEKLDYHSKATTYSKVAATLCAVLGTGAMTVDSPNVPLNGYIQPTDPKAAITYSIDSTSSGDFLDIIGGVAINATGLVGTASRMWFTDETYVFGDSANVTVTYDGDPVDLEVSFTIPLESRSCLEELCGKTHEELEAAVADGVMDTLLLEMPGLYDKLKLSTK